MKFLEKKNNLFSLALVVLILILAFLYFFPSDSETKLSTDDPLGGGVFGGNANAPILDLDYDEEFRKWTEAVQKKGPAVAYKEFKRTFAPYHFGTQHAAAHIFGEILFDEEGIDGLAYCDSTFAFGCFHSFFGKALYVLGEGVISDMDRVCVKKYGELGTGCQHGIGHGLLQHAGYNNLVDALELCKYTTQKIPIFGCTSGVFMEYNVPLITYEKEGTFGTQARELNPDNPYEPCDELPLRFRESCYYEMGQWWNKIYAADHKKLGELCHNIPDPEFEESCYLGIGNIIAPTGNYNLERTLEACGTMPTKTAERICRSGASWSFFANPDYRELAPRVCDGLDEEAARQCAKDSDLIGRGLEK